MRPSSLASYLTTSFLTVLLSIYVGQLHSQTVVFQEDFADTAKNWTIVDNGADGVTWEWLKYRTKTWPFYMAGVPGFTTYFNGFMAFDSDSAGGFGNTDQNSDMISPSFDCSLLTTVLLIFEQHTIKYQLDTCKISVSTDAVSWTDTIINQDLAESEASPNPQTITWDISSVAAGQATVYIRFQWKGFWEYWWCIDDIMVYEPCILGSFDIVTDVKCKGISDGAINLTTAGSQPPFSFKWSTKDTTEDLSNLIAGTYTVTITDSVGCEVISSYIVNEPAQSLGVFMSSTDATCQGSSDGIASASVYGGSTAYTFNWTGNRTEDVLKGMPAGAYFVTVTDANGCTVNDSIVVIESQDYVVADNDTGKCAGQSIIVGASGGFVSYSWFDGSTAQTVQIDSVGTFVVTAVDSAGCFSEDSLTVSAFVVVPPDLGSDTSICINGQFVLDAGSAYSSYQWKGGETSQSISI
ncbi:MAG: SprB repeat-containing protein, partial [Bacteroidia bacterium]|nr:SprB repeat-containing protein [Bacteroidia bacterium]